MHMKLKTIIVMLFMGAAFGLSTCGFQEETLFLTQTTQEESQTQSNPVAFTTVPADGSKVDALPQIDIVYSEAVTGADTAGNYSLSGGGTGTLAVSSVQALGNNAYRILLSGTPADGSIVLTIQNVSGMQNNALSEDTVAYLGWWDTDWTYRRKLTFKNSGQTGDLVDFPVAVLLDGTRIDYGAAGAGGKDIRFLDSDRTPLSFEIEKWDTGGESVVWVNVPVVDGASNSDFIWMYYGNDAASDAQDPGGVWDDDYMLVWHLSDQPTGLADDISNSSDALPSVAYPSDTGTGTSKSMGAGNRVIGQLGYGISFDGSADWIEPYSPANEFFHAAFSTKTFEAWIQSNDTASRQTIYEEGGSTNGFYVGIENGTVRLVTRDSSSQKEVSATFTDTASFHHVAGSYDGANNGTLLLYVDGDPKASLTNLGYTAISAHTGEPGIGYSPDSDATGTVPAKDFDGILDEVRISDSLRSADWIKAQHLAMTDGFIAFGSQE